MELCIYADYNATTPLAPEVVREVVNSMNNLWGNPSSSHPLGEKAKKAIGKARQQVACMINGSKEGIIFTSGGTEANHMVIHGALQNYPRPHIVTSLIEHDSIKIAIEELRKTSQLEVTYVTPINGKISTTDVMNAIKENTVLVTIMAANNETGVIMPLQEIGKNLFELNSDRLRKGLPYIIFHSDAAQIIGKLPIDVQDCFLDCVTIVGHKFYGPRIGAVWTREPQFVGRLFYGGGQENGLRAGTENTPMIVGLGVAAELVSKNLEAYYQKMREARDKLEQLLKSEVAIRVHCESENRLPNTLNVSFLQAPSGQELLSKCRKLLASTGAACHSEKRVSQVLLDSGISEDIAIKAVRISFGRETTLQMVTDIFSDLKQALANFSG